MREIAKFDHPYPLQQELEAYRDVVYEAGKTHRAVLEYPHIPQENSDERVEVLSIPDTNEPDALGVLIFSFQGERETIRVDSLKEYYGKHDGKETGEVIRTIAKQFLDGWWDSSSGTALSHAVEYDRLLPVRLELEASNPANMRTILTSGAFDEGDIKSLRTNDYVELSNFTVTSTRDNVLRLLGKHRSNTYYPDLRIKLKPEGRNELLSHNWGETLDTQYAKVIKTRDDLLKELGRLPTIVFALDHSNFVLDGQTYPNPLLTVDKVLHGPEKEDRRHKVELSTVHGDLNLNNIIVDQTLGVRSFFRAKTEFRQSNCLIMVKWTVKFTDLG